MTNMRQITANLICPTVSSLTRVEFIHRFLQHILPPNSKRIRHYGILANAHKTHQLSQARQSLNMPQPEPAVIESMADFIKRVNHQEWLRCPHCGIGEFILFDVRAPIPRAPP